MGKSVKILKKDDLKFTAILNSAGVTDSHLGELSLKEKSIALINTALMITSGVNYPFGTANGCEFRVYFDESKRQPGKYYLVEYLIVKYRGGEWAARCADMNSNSANFEEIGKMLDGGYYDEVEEVKRLEREACRLVCDRDGEFEIVLPSNHKDHD